MRFDIHIHTDISPCSSMSIDTIIETAKARGLDGICITDHNSMDALLSVSEGAQENGICVIVGVEYDTPEGDYLLFGPFSDLSWATGLDTDRMLARLRDRGGIAIAAHPFRKDRSVPEYIIAQGLCAAVERYNGRNSGDENSAVEPWVSRYNPVLCGGSDAHEPHEIASYCTDIDADITGRDDFINAVKSGKCVPVIGAGSEGRAPIFCK